jgi:hypothetical protein
VSRIVLAFVRSVLSLALAAAVVGQGIDARAFVYCELAGEVIAHDACCAHDEEPPAPELRRPDCDCCHALSSACTIATDRSRPLGVAMAVDSGPLGPSRPPGETALVGQYALTPWTPHWLDPLRASPPRGPPIPLDL